MDKPTEYQNSRLKVSQYPLKVSKFPTFTPSFVPRIVDVNWIRLQFGNKCAKQSDWSKMALFFPNLKKGGKTYGKNKNENSIRGLQANQADGQGYGSKLQFYSQTLLGWQDSFLHIGKESAFELRRIAGIFAYKRRRKMKLFDGAYKISIEELIATETKRISELFGKSFLDCEDIVKLTGLGRDNVRSLMKSKTFPIIKIGKRQVVSIINFVTWQMGAYLKEVNTYV